MSDKTIIELLTEIGPLDWPGETLGSDPVGRTKIVVVGGACGFQAYEWDDWYDLDRVPTTEEIAVALAHYVIDLREHAAKNEPDRQIGANVRNLLRLLR